MCFIAATQTSPLRGGGERPGGSVTEKDFEEDENAAEGLLSDYADRRFCPLAWPDLMQAAPASDDETRAMGRQAAFLEGGKGLSVDLASRRAGRFQNGLFEVTGLAEAWVVSEGGTHGDGNDVLPLRRLFLVLPLS